MTHEEHQLVIHMFVKQQQSFEILLDLLKEQGKIDLQDLARVERARRIDLGSNHDIVNLITNEYRRVGES